MIIDSNEWTSEILNDLKVCFESRVVKDFATSDTIKSKHPNRISFIDKYVVIKSVTLGRPDLVYCRDNDNYAEIWQAASNIGKIDYSELLGY